MALLIYVDESGQPHQLDEGPYVLASVAIEEDDLGGVVNSICSFIDEVRRRLGVRVDELHAKHLVKGNGPWNVPMPERAAVFLEFAKLVAELDVVLNIVAAVKERPGVKVSNPWGVRRHLIKLLVERLYLTPSSHEVAVMVFDSNSIGVDARIRLEVEEAVRSSLSPPRYRVYVSFRDSREEPPIQIADYVAYLVRQILMKRYKWERFDFEEAFLTIEPRIRRCPGKDTYEGCGLKVWHIA